MLICLAAAVVLALRLTRSIGPTVTRIAPRNEEGLRWNARVVKPGNLAKRASVELVARCPTRFPTA